MGTADRKQDDLAPETHNAEQEDEQEQAQTLTEEALGGVQDGPASKVDPELPSDGS